VCARPFCKELQGKLLVACLEAPLKQQETTAVRIFITGATGVIGRRITPRLAAAGHQITAIGRSPRQRAALQRMGVTADGVTLFERDRLRAALAGHDAVVNMATHIPSTWRLFLPGAWRENDRLRREGSANLVEAALAAGVGRVIQESFAPVYPDRGDAWIDETTPIAPVRYNVTVRDAEQAAQMFQDRGGTAVVLRFAYFYGPDSSQVRQTMHAVHIGIAPIPGAPESYVSSVSHDDAAAAVIAALGVEGGIYNVSDDRPVTRREYFATVAACVGVRPPLILPARLGALFGSLGEMLARSQRISNRKLRDACGWTPKYPSAREGWRATVQILNAAADPVIH
jgi:2-alkyl-3-oxoalkanoate reductase